MTSHSSLVPDWVRVDCSTTELFISYLLGRSELKFSSCLRSVCRVCGVPFVRLCSLLSLSLGCG